MTDMRPLSLLLLAVLSVSRLARAQAVSPASEPPAGASEPAGVEDETESTEELDLVKLLNVEVSTASKTSESVTDAPAITTVVTREDLTRWGYQSVAEVLQHVVGFYLIDDHILPNAGVRGMIGGLGAESGVIKVMIDGRSVAYRTTSGNWLGVELIPLGSIKQIEIIRGPASALYGADAFLGVVNIITLKGEDVRPVRARVVGGLTATQPGGRADVVGGGKVGRFDFLLGAAGEMTDRSGLMLPPQSPAPILPRDLGSRRVTKNLDRESLVLQGRMGYAVGDFAQLYLSAYGSGIRRGGDFAHWTQLTEARDLDGHSGTEIALQHLTLNLDALLHLHSELDLALAGTYFRGGLLPQDRIEIGSEIFYVERHQSYRGTDSVAELRWAPHRLFNAIAGVETVFDSESIEAPTRINRLTGEALPAIGTEAPGADVTLSNVGAFISVNAKVWEPWIKLTGGLRYDKHSVYDPQLTGRLGLTSRLSEELVAKLLYGSAFKAPSPFLLYSVPIRPGDVVGSPDLRPQFIHTVEGQLTYSPSRFVTMSSGVAQSWLQDKAEFMAQGLYQVARNVSRQRSFAWESRAEYTHYDDVRTYGAFERVWSQRDLGQSGYLADLIGSDNGVYPDWIGRGGVIFGIPSPVEFPLEMGTEAVLVGPRRGADTSIVEAGEDVRYPPYLLLDASLATRELYLMRGHESRFALRARNLLVARGPDPGFTGFEYPVRPAEIFIEYEHTY